MKEPRIQATGLPATALVAPTALLTGSVGTASTARADTCPDTEVIFARGTDEWPPLGGVGNGFVGALRAKSTGSVNSYGGNYPAHLSYWPAMTDQAADFAAARL